jgi:PKD repeat protein
VLDSLAVWNIFNADFGFQQYNDSISFSNLSSNYESVVWDFGDGVTSFDENPTHVYNSSGAYTISLSALTNGGCLLDTFSFTVTVLPTTLINDLNTPKELISITDILGKNVSKQKYTPLFYHFNDGTVEKKIVIE